MTQDRIAQKFRELQGKGRTGLILYLTAGYPDLEATRELVPALVEAGADCIELGVPFSDPLADGLTIQYSNFHALQNGVTVDSCLELVRELRSRVPETPLILMGYYNPFLSYGLPRFAEEAQRAGLDGVIVVDLPPEESGPLLEQCGPRGVHVIPLLAPTSTDSRIERASRTASGFIYCVSLTGITGARHEVSPGLFRLLERVRKHTDLPLVAGFGISRNEHLVSIGTGAQAAAVGSALIQVITDAPRRELVDRVRRFVLELRGAALSVRGGPK